MRLEELGQWDTWNNRQLSWACPFVCVTTLLAVPSIHCWSQFVFRWPSCLSADKSAFFPLFFWSSHVRGRDYTRNRWFVDFSSYLHASCSNWCSCASTSGTAACCFVLLDPLRFCSLYAKVRLGSSAAACSPSHQLSSFSSLSLTTLQITET